MTGLSLRFALAWGWRRWLIAAGAGALGALAMPPFGFLPALVASLVPTVWLIDGAVGRGGRVAALRAVAADGWFWGFGFFLAGLWWLGAAFLVEADEFAWAMPFGVLGLPAVLAFFPAAGFVLARLLWTRGPARVLALAVGLTVAEWLRGHLLTGFPWNVLGMALGAHLWLMQAAAYVGLYGLTLIAVLIAAAPATLTDSAGRRLAPSAAAAALLAALALAGALRVPDAPMPVVEGVRLRIMQPNLAQDEKFRPQYGGEILHRYLSISRAPQEPDGAPPAYTHLFWPESAFPFLLDRSPAALAEIAALLAPGTVLVTGAARMEEPLPGESVGRFFNAIQVIGEGGTVLSGYDKVHLVPFGEYLPRPLDALIRGIGLRQFVHVPGGFEPAERAGLLHVPGLPPAAASICYEAIFPGAVVPDGPRPSLILNVTNDAWFGRTPGPSQHFAQARLRAVEEGLPLIRAANSGISAVVDPYGRITASLALGSRGILDSPLPKAIAISVFSSLGSVLPAAMVLACLALCLCALVRARDD
jgi:apolipoprotein N-acyltransferase